MQARAQTMDPPVLQNYFLISKSKRSHLCNASAKLQTDMIEVHRANKICFTNSGAKFSQLAVSS